MTDYTFNFETSISLAVDISRPDEGSDPDLAEERAGDLAWKLAEEFLQTVGATTPGIRADATLDGIGYESVERKS
jgi:hypothetical protein